MSLKSKTLKEKRLEWHETTDMSLFLDFPTKNGGRTRIWRPKRVKKEKETK